jgi:hypothetical protein
MFFHAHLPFSRPFFPPFLPPFLSLFLSPQKVYRDAGGVPKGDALVTFAKAGSVQSACAKLTGGTQQGAGFVLSVQPATFAHRSREASDDQDGNSNGNRNGAGNEDGNNEDGINEDGDEDDGDGEEYDLDASGLPLYKPLPPPCQPARLPSVVLRNLYSDEEVVHAPGVLRNG